MSAAGHELPSSADTTSSVVLSNPDIHQSATYGSDVPQAEVGKKSYVVKRSRPY
jgi:hypothetical protein